MNEKLDRMESRRKSCASTPRIHVSSSGHDQNPSITIVPKTLHTKVNPPSSPQNSMSQVTNYPQNREQGRSLLPQVDQVPQEGLGGPLPPIQDP